MRLAAVICIPILMFSDYYLTLLGKKFRDNVYSRHMTVEEYELNPGWQKDINKFKLFNYKHVLIVILITGYFYFASLLLRDSWFDLIFGALFTLYAYINMRHLNNIFTFRFANRNPNLFSGKASIGYIFSLKVSQYQSFTIGLLMLLLFGWTQSWLILGGAMGLFLFCLTQQRWIRRYKMKLKSQINQKPESTS